MKKYLSITVLILIGIILYFPFKKRKGIFTKVAMSQSERIMINDSIFKDVDGS